MSGALRLWLTYQATLWTGLVLLQGFISARNIWRYRPWEDYVAAPCPWLDARLAQLRLYGLGYEA